MDEMRVFVARCPGCKRVVAGMVVRDSTPLSDIEEFEHDAKKDLLVVSTETGPQTVRKCICVEITQLVLSNMEQLSPFFRLQLRELGVDGVPGDPPKFDPLVYGPGAAERQAYLDSNKAQFGKAKS